MCPGDDLQECGQGMDSLFPLEEWSDEWEDGVLSGDCTKGGKLAPGYIRLHGLLIFFSTIRDLTAIRRSDRPTNSPVNGNDRMCVKTDPYIR